MARGWESKSVEAQIEARETHSKVRRRPAEQVEHMRERRNLELARARVARELESCANPRYARMLQLSLDDLDKKIAALK